MEKQSKLNKHKTAISPLYLIVVGEYIQDVIHVYGYLKNNISSEFKDIIIEDIKPT